MKHLYTFNPFIQIGETNFDVNVFNESVSLTQAQMAELFNRNTDTIGLHIKNIYKEGELLEKIATEDSSVVSIQGGKEVQRTIKIINIDVTISA